MTAPVFIFTIIVIALVILGPIWLTFNFLTRASENKRMNKAEQATLAQIAAIATRMESRMEAVERILDADSPAWRNGQSTRRQAG